MKHDPLKEWYADPTNLQQLEAVLKLPAIRKAFAVLEYVAQPRVDLVERSSADAITHDAMEQKRCQGFFSYTEHLYQLTEPLPQNPEKPVPYSDSYVLAYAKSKGLLVGDEVKEAEGSTTNGHQ